MAPTNSLLLVGSLAELAAKDCLVVAGSDRPIAVFYNEGDVCAVDNRCPHMGFPLSKAGCKDGMVICPWHHARFEAHSGSTFDLFAGDVDPFDITIEEGKVYVSALPRPRDSAAHDRRRLREGMETNNSLVSAKAILSLLAADGEPLAIIREAALFGVTHRDDWGGGLTSLAALANLLPYLKAETAYLALYQGVRRVAADCAGQTSRRERYPLETGAIGHEQLTEWIRSWVRVRHRDAAERTLLTAIACDAAAGPMASLLGGAALERVYADTGHVLDFSNKAFELLGLIGWEHARPILPTQMARLNSARGAEEQNNWRAPQDLIPPLQALCAELPSLLEAAGALVWDREAQLAQEILGEDPLRILKAYRAALVAGARPRQIAKATAYAAALRVARFSTANEIGDWLTALHTFSYCHAMHRMLELSEAPELVRGVLHGGLSIYQDRFLNVPPTRLPAGDASLPADLAVLLELLLDSLDQRSHKDEPARLVDRYLDLGHPVEPLIDALTMAVVREDADFHTIQMLEAGVQEYFSWGGGAEGRVVLVAVARYIAAFSPTQRSQQQTARIAWRLHRGEKLYEEDGPEAAAAP